ncbi:MAG: hypothetical protein M1828_006312 [Chrysothrix sp. TS-e1954]|nr:MAG: hypothetical protein M1828_006312 [Chrysothrix sp. TS-e1954]
MALNLEKQLLFGTNTPSVQTTSALDTTLNDVGLPLNLGTGAAVLYAFLYIVMEPVAGSLLAPLLVGGTAYACHLTSTYGATANYYALALHIASWVAQFIGHGIFEGRAPALLDNLVQALFLAPLFVWLEILFYFGYRPALKSRLDEAVSKELAATKKQKQKQNQVSNGSLRS